MLKIKLLIAAGLLTYLSSGYSNDQNSKSKPDASLGDLLLSVFDTAKAGLDTTAANDYLCGSLNIQTSGDWKIHSVLVNNGSIQNQIEYKLTEEKTYTPKHENTRLLQIKQLTGFLTESGLYIDHYPIDIELKISKPGGENMTTFSIQKGTCNAIQVGEVQVSVKEGNPLPYQYQRPELDDQMMFIHSASSAFYTPAHLMLPHPESVIEVEQAHVLK